MLNSPPHSKAKTPTPSCDLRTPSVERQPGINPSSHILDQWLSRRQGCIVSLIIAVSLVVRIIYFIQLSAGPLVHQHKWDQSDMHHFDYWAKQIAAGDWLSRQVRLPLHLWHITVAEHYYGRFAAEQAVSSPEPSDESEGRARARALWEGWCGKGRFYQEPLYPYCVAATYKLFGSDVRWVFIWQMLLGTVGNVLVFLIAKKCFGDLAGLLAGLFAVLYAPLLMYEMILLRETTIVFAGLALAYLMMTSLDRSSPWCWGATGLVIGVSLALKAQFWLVGAGFVVIAALSLRSRRNMAVRSVGMLLIGSAIGFTPLVVRNLVVGVPPFMTSSAVAPVFALADAVAADTYSGDQKHVAQIMKESQGRFLPTVVATLQTHPNPTSVLRLLGKRFLALWQWYEYPNNENFYYYRLHAGILRWLPLTYGCLAPLALVGLLASLRRCDRRRCVLYVILLANIPLILLSFVWSRYRLALVAPMIPFAGFVMAQMITWILANRWKTALGGAAVLVALAAWVNRPTDDSVALIRCADCVVAYQVYYTPKIEAACNQRSWPAVASILADSLRYEPDSVHRLGPANKPRSAEEKCLIELYIRKRQLLIYALDAQGRRQEAERHRLRVAELVDSLSTPDLDPLAGQRQAPP